MQEIEYSYYGRMINKPRKEFYWMVLNDCVREILDKAKVDFENQLLDLKKELKLSFKEEFDSLKKRISSQANRLDEMEKKFSYLKKSDKVKKKVKVLEEQAEMLAVKQKLKQKGYSLNER